MDDQTPPSAFEDFWQASSLDRFNIDQLKNRIGSFNEDNKQLVLEYPLTGQALPRPSSKLNQLAKKRVSQRSFSSRALSRRDLGLILSSFYAWGGLEHRSYPSAGASYSLEVFGVGFNVKGYSNKVFYYDPENHAVVSLNKTAPDWQQASDWLNIEVAGAPQLLILLVTFPSRVAPKYGDRGYRFMLLEAGAAMQQLALQIANSSAYKGVAVGGTFDEQWLKVLGLEKSEALVVLGYLVGR